MKRIKKSSDLNLEYRDIADWCTKIIGINIVSAKMNSLEPDGNKLTRSLFDSIHHEFTSKGWDINVYKSEFENCVMISKALNNEKLFIWSSEVASKKVLVWEAEGASEHELEGIQSDNLEAENPLLIKTLQAYLKLISASKPE